MNSITPNLPTAAPATTAPTTRTQPPVQETPAPAPTETVTLGTSQPTVQETPPQPAPEQPRLMSLDKKTEVGQGMVHNPNLGVIFMEEPVQTGVLTSRDLLAASERTALQAIPQATLTPAGKAALELAMRYMTPDEILAGNTGTYHSQEHAINVAGAIGEVASNLGRSPERVLFLQQVGLLHDFDERLNLKTGERNPTGPARVQVTLEWMDQNQSAIESRFGWKGTQFDEARAIIARTDFPFDDKPRAYGTRYDNKSPQQVYMESLERLPAERRAQVMEDGIALSFADQVGNYIGTPDQARDNVYGLAKEIKMDGPTLLKGSAAFQASVAKDISVDQRIARELGVTDAQLPTREQLEASLSAPSRENLLRNRAYFESVAKS